MSSGSPPHAVQTAGARNGVEASTRWFRTRFRYSFSRAGIRAASAAIASTSRLFMKRVERGIGGPDRLLGERIKLRRRGIEPHDRRRIGASQRVIDKDREEIAVGRRLRRDDDAQRGFLRPDRGFKSLVQRRARPANAAKLVMDDQARRQAESRRRLGRQRPIRLWCKPRRSSQLWAWKSPSITQPAPHSKSRERFCV